jgi:hypothetical protein
VRVSREPQDSSAKPSQYLKDEGDIPQGPSRNTPPLANPKPPLRIRDSEGKRSESTQPSAQHVQNAPNDKDSELERVRDQVREDFGEQSVRFSKVLDMASLSFGYL